MLYFDNNATTAIIPSVIDKMLPFLEREYGNPSSRQNRLGRAASDAVDEAREHVAKLLGAKTSEVVFVSGGTESIAHSIIGTARAAATRASGKRHYLYSAVEHPAVIESIRFLEDLIEVEVAELPVLAKGGFDFSALESKLGASTALVSVMLANNESGIIFPIAKIAHRVHQSGALLHCDAVQAAGKIPICFADLNVDLMSVSAHKFGGPKGVGALIVKDGTAWEPVIPGGGQESGRRGGTSAVSQIVGMGEAARVKHEMLSGGLSGRLAELRDSFESRLLDSVAGISVQGADLRRLPNTSCLTISDVLAGDLVEDLVQSNMIISAGSACKSGDPSPSHVLRAMALPVGSCLSTVRISFGGSNTEKEVSQLIDQTVQVVANRRREAGEVVSKLSN